MSENKILIYLLINQNLSYDIDNTVLIIIQYVLELLV